MRLTIIIPTYNTQDFVINAIESIRLQENINHNEYEVLIVDDGSTDKTNEVVKEHLEKYKLINFTYIYKSNGNWGSVLNYCKNNNLIKGDYFTILDSDDRFLNNCFKEIFPFLNNENDVVVTNVKRFKNNKIGRKIEMFHTKEGFIKESKRFIAITIPLCKFYKTNFLFKIDNFVENVFYQDQILFYEYMLKSKNVYYIKKSLGLYWINRRGSSSVIKYNEEKIKTLMNNINYLAKYNNKYLNGQLTNIFCYVYHGTTKKNNFLLNKYLKTTNFFKNFSAMYSRHIISLNVHFKITYFIFKKRYLKH